MEKLPLTLMRNYKLAEKIIDRSDLDALADWLKEDHQLTKGPLTWEFERQWAQWIGTKYAVFCNSGSSANLLLAYAALESGRLKNRKVVVPSVGWVTTVAPFIQFGYEPIMCGADSENFGLDLNNLEEILKKEDPGAVIMVQVLGVPSAMYQIKALQEKYGFMLFEDACAALGSAYDGRRVGNLSDMSTFSFYFGHQLSTIEGGMVNTNDEDLYYLLLMLRSHGWGKDLPPEVEQKLLEKFQVDDFHKPFTFLRPGFNLRGTDLNAFLGLRMIKKAQGISEIRHRNHLLYSQNLKTVTFQKWNHLAWPCSISFGALAEDEDHRRRLCLVLDENQIETRLFSAGNLGRHPFWFERYGQFHHPVSDAVHDRGFFLPNHESLTEEDVTFICEVVNGVEV